MTIEFGRNWWTFALRGLVALGFGLIALMWPGIALGALILLFGLYALLDGLLALVVALLTRRVFSMWWAWLLEALVGLSVGLLALFRPGTTETALLYLIAAWAIVSGAFEIVAVIQFRRIVEHDWLLGLDGALSVVLGVLLLARPSQGVLAVSWIIGLYAILVGLVLLVLAFHVRRLVRLVDRIL